MRQHWCATTLQGSSPSVLSKFQMLPLLHAFPLSLVREWRHPEQCAIIVITSFTPPPHHHHPRILEPATCHFSALLELRVCRLSGAKQCDISCILICFAWFCLLFPPREFLPPPSSLDKLTFILAYFPPLGVKLSDLKTSKESHLYKGSFSAKV